MKKLLIPVIVAVLAGVGGGSGFAYRAASRSYVADSTHYADSVAAHPPADTLSAGTSVDKHDSLVTLTDSTPSGLREDAPITPADSLRAVVASRTAAAAAAGHGNIDTTSRKAAPKPVAPSVNASAITSTSAVANMVRDARNDAMTTALPEQRLAKIFAAMSAKDAAKVLDQMSDHDIREILSLMNDRAAAAVLVQFAPARAAAITKGADKPVNKEPGHVP